MNRITGGMALTLISACARATILTNIAIQDLNGRGGEDVLQQTAEYVEFKNDGSSHIYNRKALFLFSFTNFAGRDVMDQYLHSALFRVHARDNHDTNNHVRLWGFTDATGNRDSAWHEGITAQTDPNWLAGYWGAYWYPSGNGVTGVETQRGVRNNQPITFSGSGLLNYCRWGADRHPTYGYSTSNPDGRITFMLNREEEKYTQDGIHARESTEDGGIYKPYLVLDVRFPSLRVGLGTSNNLPAGGLYDFGVIQETNPVPIAADLVMDNVLGEALSSLHVTSVVITGEHAACFGVATTNAFVGQGSSNRCLVVFGPGATNTWGFWDRAWLTIRCNDPDRRIFSVRLRGEVFPQLRFTQAVSLVEPNRVGMAWASRTARWYTVWGGVDLAAGIWTSNTSRQAQGAECGWTNDQPDGPRVFYRVELQP